MTRWKIEFREQNEVGDREVVFDEQPSWWKRLFRVSPRRLVFVQDAPSTVWWHKGSGRSAGTLWDSECCDVVEFFRQKGRHDAAIRG